MKALGATPIVGVCLALLLLGPLRDAAAQGNVLTYPRAGATGDGTLKARFAEGDRGSYTYEFQITTP